MVLARREESACLTTKRADRRPQTAETATKARQTRLVPLPLTANRPGWPGFRRCPGVQLAAIVEKGPDRAVDGVVRWRRIDLKRVIRERFGVDYDTRYVGKLLHRLGFSHVSARPQHPAQDAYIVAEFKKTGPAR